MTDIYGLKKNLKLFKISKKRKTYIITTSSNKKKIDFLKKKKIKIIKIKKLLDKKDFYNIFRKLYNIGYGRVLIESGLVFLNKLFKYKIINNLYIFKSNKLLKDQGFNNDKSNFIKKLKLNNKIKVNLDTDELYRIKIR